MVLGEDIPSCRTSVSAGVPGLQDRPIFFNTMEDAGALPIEIDVSAMDMGDEVELKVDQATAVVTAFKNGEKIAEAALKTPVILDEVPRAGGRIPLIIGRGLTAKAREALGLPHPPCSACRRIPPTVAGASRWRRRWSVAPAACRKARAFAGHLLRAEDDHRRLPGHHRPDDPRRLKDLACLGFPPTW